MRIGRPLQPPGGSQKLFWPPLRLEDCVGVKLGVKFLTFWGTLDSVAQERGSGIGNLASPVPKRYRTPFIFITATTILRSSVQDR